MTPSKRFVLIGFIAGLAVWAVVAFATRPLSDLLYLLHAPDSIATLLQRNTLIRTCAGVALGSMIWTAIGLVLPVHQWATAARTLAQAIARRSGPDPGFALPELPSVASAMAERLGPVLGVAAGPGALALPADRLMEADALYGRPLSFGLFRGLATGLPAVGVLVALGIIVHGLYAYLEAQSVMIRLVSDPFLSGILVAIASLLMLGTGGFVVHLLVRTARSKAEQARAALLDVVTALAPDRAGLETRQGFALLAERQGQTLAPAIEALEQAARTLAADQSREIARVGETLIGQFAGQLQLLTSEQTGSLAADLARLGEATTAASTAAGSAAATLQGQLAEQVARIDAAVTSAIARIEGLHQDQAASVGGVVAAAISELREALTNQTGDVRRMHDEAIGLLRQATADATGTTELLHTAILREQDSAERVSQAAQQMQAAAVASRETVERFIALAERMRDLSRSIGAAITSTPAPDTTPLADPRTSMRLSSAIRELQRAADVGLPELK